MNQADKQEIRTNLLFAFAPALAEAIAKNHWKAVEIAKAYQAAIDVLVTPSESVNPEVFHMAESAEALKWNLDANGVPTHNECGYEYSLWGRVQVLAEADGDETAIN